MRMRVITIGVVVWLILLVARCGASWTAAALGAEGAEEGAALWTVPAILDGTSDAPLVLTLMTGNSSSSSAMPPAGVRALAPGLAARATCVLGLSAAMRAAWWIAGDCSSAAEALRRDGPPGYARFANLVLVAGAARGVWAAVDAPGRLVVATPWAVRTEALLYDGATPLALSLLCASGASDAVGASGECWMLTLTPPASLWLSSTTAPWAGGWTLVEPFAGDVPLSDALLLDAGGQVVALGAQTEGALSVYYRAAAGNPLALLTAVPLSAHHRLMLLLAPASSGASWRIADLAGERILAPNASAFFGAEGVECIAPAGYYGAAAACPAGTYNPAMGATHPDACLPCPAGTASATPGAVACPVCPAARPLQGPLGLACVAACPSWSAALQAGGGRCPACPLAGQAGPQCAPCPAMSWATRGAPCLPCAAGTVSAAGASACVPSRACFPDGASPRSLEDATAAYAYTVLPPGLLPPQSGALAAARNGTLWFAGRQGGLWELTTPTAPAPQLRAAGAIVVASLALAADESVLYYAAPAGIGRLTASSSSSSGGVGGGAPAVVPGSANASDLCLVRATASAPESLFWLSAAGVTCDAPRLRWSAPGAVRIAAYGGSVLVLTAGGDLLAIDPRQPDADPAPLPGVAALGSEEGMGAWLLVGDWPVAGGIAVGAAGNNNNNSIAFYVPAAGGAAGGSWSLVGADAAGRVDGPGASARLTAPAAGARLQPTARDPPLLLLLEPDDGALRALWVRGCECAPGFFRDAAAANDACLPCPAARPRSAPGAVGCTACLQGQYTDAAGACRECPATQWWRDGATAPCTLLAAPNDGGETPRYTLVDAQALAAGLNGTRAVFPVSDFMSLLLLFSPSPNDWLLRADALGAFWALDFTPFAFNTNTDYDVRDPDNVAQWAAPALRLPVAVPTTTALGAPGAPWNTARAALLQTLNRSALEATNGWPARFLCVSPVHYWAYADYTNATRGGACLPCPPGEFAYADDALGCAAPAVGGDDEGPAQCPPGTYLRPLPLPRVCVPCPAGTFAAAPAVGACAPKRVLACPPDTRLYDDGVALSENACVPCDACASRVPYDGQCPGGNATVQPYVCVDPESFPPPGFAMRYVVAPGADAPPVLLWDYCGTPPGANARWAVGPTADRCYFGCLYANVRFIDAAAVAAYLLGVEEAAVSAPWPFVPARRDAAARICLPCVSPLCPAGSVRVAEDCGGGALGAAPGGALARRRRLLFASSSSATDNNNDTTTSTEAKMETTTTTMGNNTTPLEIETTTTTAGNDTTTAYNDTATTDHESTTAGVETYTAGNDTTTGNDIITTSAIIIVETTTTSSGMEEGYFTPPPQASEAQTTEALAQRTTAPTAQLTVPGLPPGCALSPVPSPPPNAHWTAALGAQGGGTTAVWECDAGWFRSGGGCAPCDPAGCAPGEHYVADQCTPETSGCTPCPPELPAGAGVLDPLRGGGAQCVYNCSINFTASGSQGCAPCPTAACPPGSLRGAFGAEGAEDCAQCTPCAQALEEGTRYAASGCRIWCRPGYHAVNRADGTPLLDAQPAEGLDPLVVRCDDCARRPALPCGMCPPGASFAFGGGGCTPCPPTVCPDAGTFPVPCPGGSVAAVVGVCAACPPLPPNQIYVTAATAAEGGGAEDEGGCQDSVRCADDHGGPACTPCATLAIPAGAPYTRYHATWNAPPAARWWPPAFDPPHLPPRSAAAPTASSSRAGLCWPCQPGPFCDAPTTGALFVMIVPAAPIRTKLSDASSAYRRPPQQRRRLLAAATCAATAAVRLAPSGDVLEWCAAVGAGAGAASGAPQAQALCAPGHALVDARQPFPRCEPCRAGAFEAGGVCRLCPAETPHSRRGSTACRALACATRPHGTRCAHAQPFQPELCACLPGHYLFTPPSATTTNGDDRNNNATAAEAPECRRCPEGTISRTLGNAPCVPAL